MGRGTWSWIVPDGLWEIAKPLIPPDRVRPQNAPDEPLFAAIVHVLVSGCAWRALPPCFGVSTSTVHRRLLIEGRCLGSARNRSRAGPRCSTVVASAPARSGKRTRTSSPPNGTDGPSDQLPVRRRRAQPGRGRSRHSAAARREVKGFVGPVLAVPVILYAAAGPGEDSPPRVGRFAVERHASDVRRRILALKFVRRAAGEA
ncbi:transposase [Streptosporangium sp. NPDC020072]|uniref:transposase n=1 Tax=Streptosporangium sp. NPDC020072 TaxID=3154788 RepID=UPI00341A0226